MTDVNSSTYFVVVLHTYPGSRMSDSGGESWHHLVVIGDDLLKDLQKVVKAKGMDVIVIASGEGLKVKRPEYVTKYYQGYFS